MPRENVICTRLDEDYTEKLDALVTYLNETKPTSKKWNRASVLRHLIDRFYDAIPKEHR
jgi:hypothetical protein